MSKKIHHQDKLPVQYIIHNSASSSEKAISSESGEKYAQIKNLLQAKTVQNSCKQISWWMTEQQGIELFTGGSVIMDYGLVFLPEATFYS